MYSAYHAKTLFEDSMVPINLTIMSVYTICSFISGFLVSSEYH